MSAHAAAEAVLPSNDKGGYTVPSRVTYRTTARAMVTVYFDAEP